MCAWHKVLDTITGNQVIVYMTTNNHNVISNFNHGSIIRTERVDQQEYIGNVKIGFVNELLNKHFQIDTVNLTSKEIYHDKNEVTLLTPADIINAIKITKGNLRQTVNHIVTTSYKRSSQIEIANRKMINRTVKKL